MGIILMVRNTINKKRMKVSRKQFGANGVGSRVIRSANNSRGQTNPKYRWLDSFSQKKKSKDHLPLLQVYASLNGLLGSATKHGEKKINVLHKIFERKRWLFPFLLSTAPSHISCR